MRKIFGILIAFVIIGIQTKADSAETRYFTDFNSVYVFGNLTVRLVKSDSTYAVLKGDSAYLGKISTKVKDNQLIVKFNKMGSSKTMDVIVFYKSIDEIIAKAGATVVANQAFNVDEFYLKLSQGSDADLEIFSKSMKIRIAQGSDFKVKGSVENVEVVSNSGAGFYGYNLKASNANLKVATGGMINISLSGDVEASAHTRGTIFYKGVPKSISQSVSTGGEIKQKK
ncbi:MAG: hypothetical protein B6I18_06455 [Bacteroidetes bacterium 4572_112]|nr:MAG: hypothetical protein B6I18_06455 [Bacteroidetes bacterium 4572_112]